MIKFKQTLAYDYDCVLNFIRAKNKMAAGYIA